MASQTSQNIGHQAGELTGQAQVKRDEILNKASHGSNPDQSSDQDSSYASQATNFLQQTGESVKNIAQGAADAVKNTLGMNSDNPSNAPGSSPSNAPGANHPSSAPGTNHPSSAPGTNHPSSAPGTNHPSNAPSTNHPSNPSSRA